MRALIAVAGVHALSAQREAGLETRVQRRIGVRGVAGVHVHRVVQRERLAAGDQLVGQVPVVGAGGVLRADGYLRLAAGEVVAHAAHVHREHVLHRQVGQLRRAVADLLVHGEGEDDPAPRLHIALRDRARKPQQHRGAALVVKEAALDVAAFGHDRAGIEADEIARADAQRLGFLAAVRLLVQHDLQRARVALLRCDIAPHMTAGMDALHRGGIGLARAGMHQHVFIFNRVVVEAADAAVAQAAVGFDGAHHRAQRVHMRADQQAVPFAAKAAQHRAFAGFFGPEAQASQLRQQVGGRASSHAGGTGNGHERPELLNDIGLRIHA